ncbi:hypothetical protein J1N35_028649 [Gossypium stocksii]|uniref:DUF4283 domain-containing protein n=1 Tax=Gossypium stocksii TaxID=47602 RepID=A0A9D3UWE4_9ROSI|nr:hypothetical protein J1N35_028649 [Gossypium stocksii]
MVLSERVTWIEISGVPMYCWNYETFKRVTGKWGILVSMGEDLSRTMNFEKIEMLISITQLKKLEEVVLLEVGDIRFPISVREKRWSEESKNISAKMESRQDVADESVLESKPESVVGLESEKSPDGNRNVLANITMENDIENERVGKECQKMLGELNEGDHNAVSFRILAGEDFGVNRSFSSRDRAREDVVDMGLASVMGSSDQARKDVVNMEEFIQTIRSRRKKKHFNKKISFMRAIQDGVLTSKEKHKRDRTWRKEKGRDEFIGKEKIVNLSLSDSDVNNRRKVILREAKQTWEVGKKLGLRVRGDERDIIEDIMRLENQ